MASLSELSRKAPHKEESTVKVTRLHKLNIAGVYLCVLGSYPTLKTTRRRRKFSCVWPGKVGDWKSGRVDRVVVVCLLKNLQKKIPREHD